MHDFSDLYISNAGSTSSKMQLLWKCSYLKYRSNGNPTSKQPRTFILASQGKNIGTEVHIRNQRDNVSWILRGIKFLMSQPTKFDLAL